MFVVKEQMMLTMESTNSLLKKQIIASTEEVQTLRKSLIEQKQSQSIRNKHSSKPFSGSGQLSNRLSKMNSIQGKLVDRERPDSERKGNDWGN